MHFELHIRREVPYILVQRNSGRVHFPLPQGCMFHCQGSSLKTAQEKGAFFVVRAEVTGGTNLSLVRGEELQMISEKPERVPNGESALLH